MAFYDPYRYGPYIADDPGEPGPGPGAPPSAPAGSTPIPTGAGSGVTLPPAPGGGGGGGGGGQSLGPGGRPTFNLPGVPGFTPPAFTVPTLQSALQEPGFQFRLQGGQDALQRSAAARGVLRTGGTLKDFIDYGQNFASAEYSNVFNRALQEYDRKYQGARDQFAPMLAQWQTRADLEKAAGLAAFQREWDQYTFGKGGGGGGGGGPAEPPPMPPNEEDYF